MTEHKCVSLFFGSTENIRTKMVLFFLIRTEGLLRETRTGPRPPFRKMRGIRGCHPPLPPSTSRRTGTSICSYVIQFFVRCLFPPFCASLGGSETRFSPASRTSSGTWRSRCASVWRGTCSKWTRALAPKVACWWRLCACVCCSEVCCCCFLQAEI